MQTTVPFIDVQDVAPKAATWLSGVGTYHKGNMGYGGYIGLSVQSYDFSRHMIPDLTSEHMSKQQSVVYDLKLDDGVWLIESWANKLLMLIKKDLILSFAEAK